MSPRIGRLGDALRSFQCGVGMYVLWFVLMVCTVVVSVWCLDEAVLNCAIHQYYVITNHIQHLMFLARNCVPLCQVGPHFSQEKKKILTKKDEY